MRSRLVGFLLLIVPCSPLLALDITSFIDQWATVENSSSLKGGESRRIGVELEFIYPNTTATIDEIETLRKMKQHIEPFFEPGSPRVSVIDRRKEIQKTWRLGFQRAICRQAGNSNAGSVQCLHLGFQGSSSAVAANGFLPPIKQGFIVPQLLALNPSTGKFSIGSSRVVGGLELLSGRAIRSVVQRNLPMTGKEWLREIAASDYVLFVLYANAQTVKEACYYRLSAQTLFCGNKRIPSLKLEAAKLWMEEALSGKNEIFGQAGALLDNVGFRLSIDSTAGVELIMDPAPLSVMQRWQDVFEHIASFGGISSQELPVGSVWSLSPFELHTGVHVNLELEYEEVIYLPAMLLFLNDHRKEIFHHFQVDPNRLEFLGGLKPTALSELRALQGEKNPDKVMAKLESLVQRQAMGKFSDANITPLIKQWTQNNLVRKPLEATARPAVEFRFFNLPFSRGTFGKLHCQSLAFPYAVLNWSKNQRPI